MVFPWDKEQILRRGLKKFLNEQWILKWTVDTPLLSEDLNSTGVSKKLIQARSQTEKQSSETWHNVEQEV